jgi:hypothetical protein
LVHTTVRVLAAPAKKASVCPGAMPVDGFDAAIKNWDFGTSRWLLSNYPTSGARNTKVPLA